MTWRAELGGGVGLYLLGHGSLAVGEGLGNAIDNDLDAADAEAGAGAEAPNRRAQILREIVSIEKEQTGHAAE